MYKEHNYTATWKRENLFNPQTIHKSVTITPVQKFKLLFVRSRYSLDEDDTRITRVRYKAMNKVAYILDVKHYPKGEEKK